MNTQTGLVAEQIRDCRNRPSDMKVDAWCQQHGITKANYYYRLRRVQETCLELCGPSPSFVEPTTPEESMPAKSVWQHLAIGAVFHLDSYDRNTLFCGRRIDRIKGLLWEGDGFLLLYKRLDTGAFN